MIDTPFPAYTGDQPYFFVCYAHADATQVFDEMTWLHEAGIRLWYDDGVRMGTVWRRVLAQALEGASGLIFLQTAQSVESEFCLNEIRFALDEEKPVFVVTLESARLPAELRLSLGDRQALVKSNHTVADYRAKLTDALRTCIGDNDLTTPEIDETRAPWLRRRRQHRQRRLFTATVMLVDTDDMTSSQGAADDIAASGGEILSQEGSLLFAAFDSASAAARLVTAKPRAWRVGVSGGDLLFEDGLYHGAPLVEAKNLIQCAGIGETLCTRQFCELLAPESIQYEERGTLAMDTGGVEGQHFGLVTSKRAALADPG